jgi:hypothetical protein
MLNKNKEIRLTKEEMILLRRLPAFSEAKVSYLEKISEDEHLLIVSEDYAFELYRGCRDAFQDYGIGKDDEPNDVGLIYEDLAEKF